MKTLANDALNPSKIEDYLRIVHEEYGEDATNTTMHYIIIVTAKYLQMMSSYYINENNPEAVEKIFHTFNENYLKYEQVYRKVTGKKIIFGRIQKHQMQYPK